MAEYLCEADMSTGEYISRDVALRQLNATCLAIDCDNYNGVRCRACAYADAMDFIDAIPAADVQPVKWISVKDRLPDESCECLGVVDGEVTEVSYRSKQKEFICVWSMCDADGFKPLSDDAVTHWMPLPEPPKNGDVE
jgi:hypothetical protein